MIQTLNILSDGNSHEVARGNNPRSGVVDGRTLTALVRRGYAIRLSDGNGKITAAGKKALTDSEK